MANQQASPPLTLEAIAAAVRAAGLSYRTEARADVAGGKQLRAQCPAHRGDDRNTTLWVGSSGGLGATCWSVGCSWQSIRDGLQLPEHTQRFTYYTRGGAERIERRVNRAGGGAERRARLAAGERDKDVKMPGDRRVRPRLQGEGDGPIAIVEGAKAGDALAAMLPERRVADFPGGTGGVEQWVITDLEGADVILWPDADDGRKAFNRLAARLQPIAASVRMVDTLGLPEKADAADVDAAQARALLDGAPPWTPPERPVAEAGGPGDGLQWWEYERTDLAAAMRLLREHADRLLVVRHDAPEGRTCEVLVTDGALWRRSVATLRRLLVDAQHRAAQRMVDGRRIAQLEASARDCAGNRKSADVLSSLEAAALTLEAMGKLPDALLQCASTALDRGAYMGAPNGVYDAANGRLLTGADARGALCTRPLPDAIDLDAQHPDASELWAHVDDDLRAYLLGALGFHALDDAPGRRLYLLEGPPGGGKTTLLEALSAALGPYAGHARAKALQADDEQTNPELKPWTQHRLVLMDDYASRQRPTRGRITEVTGSGTLKIRDLHVTEREAHNQGTLIITCNTGARPPLPLDDPAVYERVYVLPYPELPRKDAQRRAARFEGQSPDAVRARQALVAMLLRAAGSAPPEPPESVTAARDEARDADGGDAGAWIREAIVERPGSRLTTGEAWEAALDAAKRANALDSDGLPWGVRRDQRNGLLNRITLAYSRRVMKSHGLRYWDGLALADADAPPDPPAGGAPAPELPRPAAPVQRLPHSRPAASEPSTSTAVAPSAPDEPVSASPGLLTFGVRVCDRCNRQHTGESCPYCDAGDCPRCGRPAIEGGGLALHYRYGTRRICAAGGEAA